MNAISRKTTFILIALYFPTALAWAFAPRPEIVALSVLHAS
jgi:hypothetical protein